MRQHFQLLVYNSLCLAKSFIHVILAFYKKKIISSQAWQQQLHSDIENGHYDQQLRSDPKNLKITKSYDLQKIQTQMMQQMTINLNTKIFSFVNELLTDDFVQPMNERFERIIKGQKAKESQSKKRVSSYQPSSL